jgi:4-amino-4-deoxy-L-arabinose transferase-like glycosyltransferase
MPRSKPNEHQETCPKSFLGALRASLDPRDLSTRLDSKLALGVALAALVVPLIVLLLAFARKPFHMDDPLFIWVARQIQTDPYNPYGFSVNWYGVPAPVSDITKNPPLASYYIVSMAALTGWSEPALHLIFIIASLAVAIGAYLVSARFCTHPLLAALAGVLTPVFFVSSLSVMCDVLMLAFWVFAVYFWVKGLDTGHRGSLLAAALLITAAATTKYFGMMLIPLLAVYAILRRRTNPLIFLLIPVVVLGWYQWTTQHLYGRGLLLDAASYATEMKTDFAMAPVAKSFVAFAFTGGCIATVLCFALQLWSRKWVIAGLLFMLGCFWVLKSVSAIGSFSFPSDGFTHSLISAQLSLWGTAGISLIVLAALDLHRRRNPDSFLLFSWIIGTFLFAGFINWTTNGRSILPMIIPAGILITRRLELQTSPRRGKILPVTIPLALAFVLSFLVTQADVGLAYTAKSAAAQIHRSYGARQTVWFQGHWGFQYYMEQMGAKPMNFQQFQPNVGDVVVVPATNTNLAHLPPNWPLVQTVDIPSLAWISTMNFQAGAGFYADVFGPLPFVIAPVMPERFSIFEVAR